MIRAIIKTKRQKVIKMKQENYSYPAIFDYSEAGYIDINICDFEGCTTCTVNEQDGIQSAREALALKIMEYEGIGREMPKPSQISEIKLGENQRLVFIDIWMPYWRTKAKEVYVKKTLTIPSWIDVLAKEKNLNFSNVLVKGLKRELGIEE